MKTKKERDFMRTNIKQLYVINATYKKWYGFVFTIACAGWFIDFILSRFTIFETVRFLAGIKLGIELVSIGATLISIYYLAIFLIIACQYNIFKTIYFSHKLREVLKVDGEEFKKWNSHVLGGSSVFYSKKRGSVVVIPKKFLHGDQRKKFEDVLKSKVQAQLSFIFGDSIPEIEETLNYYYMYINC